MEVRKKMIEVALPLEAINEASAREKSIRHGHPSTLHLWWARRPLAAARAVIFAQMVDDPSTYADELLEDDAVRRAAARELEDRLELWRKQVEAYEAEQQSGRPSAPEAGPEPTLAQCAADLEQDRLFRLIEELVKWENTTNEALLEEARREIRKSWRRSCNENRKHPRAAELFDPERLPAFHDPFAGGGALPLEAQRLGLEAHASDLNPVAVLINKAMIEIPPRFGGLAPVNLEVRRDPELFQREWKGAEGLAEDVRRYGEWMRDRAKERIGHLYPSVTITPELVKERPDLKQYEGRELTVIAWLWARTVRSPNPAFSHVHVPLVSNFMLSTKKGKESHVEPILEGDGYRFEVRKGKPEDVKAAKAGTSAGSRQGFRCLMSGSAIDYDHIRHQGRAGGMGARLMAMVLEGDRERVYVSPDPRHSELAEAEEPSWSPAIQLPDNTRDFKTPNYGLTTYGDLFTPRQLVALNTFSDLVGEARERARLDAIEAGMPDDGVGLASGGTGATAYGEAVGVYLALSVDKVADYSSSLVAWSPSRDQAKTTFARQALPMVWDFAEVNVFAEAAGDLTVSLRGITRTMSVFGVSGRGEAYPEDAQTNSRSELRVVSTDPPYYDNIGYADLSDFFYVWLRRSLSSVFPNLFDTIAVPKAEELVATPYRHGGKETAEEYFISGMTRAMARLRDTAHPCFPTTIYYAFKQSETRGDGGTASTGWETFLEAIMQAGLSIHGTWPIRTERQQRSIGIGANALASSIVLVCRRRQPSAQMATRREFISTLKAELPKAVVDLQRGNIAPVDLAQASIGPGMAIFTSYACVKESDGSDMSVRTALQLVNQVLDEALAEQEGDFDADTRWALAWFDEFGVDEGPYGRAETLSTAKNTSVAGMVDAGILASGRGKVRLLRRGELDPDWDPRTDPRLTIWEVAQHLIRALETDGEMGAAALLSRLGGGMGETARELAYRLYAICERKKWAQEAIAYNTLVTSWPEVSRLSREVRTPRAEQVEAF